MNKASVTFPLSHATSQSSMLTINTLQNHATTSGVISDLRLAQNTLLIDVKICELHIKCICATMSHTRILSVNVSSVFITF